MQSTNKRLVTRSPVLQKTDTLPLLHPMNLYNKRQVNSDKEKKRRIERKEKNGKENRRKRKKTKMKIAQE